jgi:hypothetical protein
MAQSEPAGGIQDAVERTIGAIERRLRLYRNLIIAVLLLFFALVIMSAANHSWLPFAALTLVFPIAWGYIHLDTRIVRGWTRQMRDVIGNGLSPQLLATALRQHPTIPRRTIEGMLATLAADKHRPTSAR